MSDSTAHNLGVVEEICKNLNVKETPGSLVCNVHSLMVLDRKMKELCQKLHDCLGGEKLVDCFVVDVDFEENLFLLKQSSAYQILFAKTSLLSHGITVNILVSLSNQNKM